MERLVQEHQTLVAAATADRREAVMDRCGLALKALEEARNSVE